MRMGTQGSSPRNYTRSCHHDHTRRAVWWSLNQTNTARWRHDRDGGKGGQTGRVGTEVTDLNKWKELRLAVGHFSQNGLSV